MAKTGRYFPIEDQKLPLKSNTAEHNPADCKNTSECEETMNLPSAMKKSTRAKLLHAVRCTFPLTFGLFTFPSSVSLKSGTQFLYLDRLSVIFSGPPYMTPWYDSEFGYDPRFPIALTILVLAH